MIDVQCRCGSKYQVLNEQVAAHAKCPRCGTRAAESLGMTGDSQTAPQETAELSGASEMVEQIAAESAPQAEAPQGELVIACVNHPEYQAAYNCMNCGKPICVECVHAGGYYCSAACKEEVMAREPREARDETDIAAIEERTERTMSVLGSVLKKSALVVAAMMVLAIGWAVYKHFWGPRGRVTASVSTASAMALFKASLVEPDLAAVQANNDLMLIRLSSKEKIWSLNLASLEKKYVPPKAMDEAARQSIDAEAIAQFRDPLRFVEAAGGSLLLHSDRQLMVVDAKTGNVKWEFFSPDVSIDHAQLHSAGVLCKLREFSTDFRRRNLRLVNFALDNGAETWSVSEGLTYGDNLVISHNQAAWLSRQPSPAPARGTLTAAPEAMREAMEQFGFDADEEWNYADDARAAATKFDLNVVSLADGKSVATQTFALVGFAALEHVGEYLCVRSRDRLVMLKSGAEPIWEKPLDAKPQRLASGGAVLAVATEKNLVAYDIATGRERWSRAGLEIEQLAVGADGAVFATVRVSSEEAKQGEAAKYRLTGFPGAGMTDPRAPVTVLLKLDPDSGKTLWGVRDVGRDLKITPEGIYAFDHVTQLNLLASQGPFVGYYSVRCLKPQNGKEAWAYEGRGDLYHHELAGKKVFLVTAKDPPEGRANPRCNYDLQTVERR